MLDRRKYVNSAVWGESRRISSVMKTRLHSSPENKWCKNCLQPKWTTAFYEYEYKCLLASLLWTVKVNCVPPSLKRPITCAFQMLFKKCNLMSTAIFWSCQAGVERRLPQYLHSASVVCSLPIRHRPISRVLFLLWSVLMDADLH